MDDTNTQPNTPPIEQDEFDAIDDIAPQSGFIPTSINEPLPPVAPFVSAPVSNPAPNLIAAEPKPIVDPTPQSEKADNFAPIAEPVVPYTAPAVETPAPVVATEPTKPTKDNFDSDHGALPAPVRPMTSEPATLPAVTPVADAPTTAPMPAPATGPAQSNFTEISIDLIQPNPWQPRKVFKEEQLNELSASIREHGVLQPLVVVPTPEGYYQLIVGERRLRASKLAGLTKVPVIIRDAMEEQKKLELALIENIQRHNLDPIEEAMAYQQMADVYHMTQEDIAKKVGKGRTTVTNMLRLLQLPLRIQRAVAEGEISEGHARSILSVIGMEKQLALYELVVAENMTVRQVEDKAREIMERPKQIKAPRAADPEVQALETELRGKLGTKVKVQKHGESGKILIEFYSQEELNSFMDRIHKME